MKKTSFEEQVLYGNSKSLKVLLVIHHAGTRLKLAAMLKKYFSEVNICTFASAALLEFSKAKFDLIITEHHLLDMDGYMLCKNIKHIAPKKPIVVVSNKSEVDELIDLINIGVDGFIRVPLEKEEIIPILTRVTNNISDMNMLYKSFDLNYLIDVEDKKGIKAEAKKDYPKESVDTLFKNLSSMSAKDFMDAYPTDLEIIGDKLLEIIDDMDISINKFLNHTTKENALELALEFTFLNT